ncbi:MAG: hypothetical protein JXB85_06490 [Anaerolineales bacterium]|nr:hypothetical protein [Anaerolineales bacterium]
MPNSPRTDPGVRIFRTGLFSRTRFLAEGSRTASQTRVKGYQEDTILDWLCEAARHIQGLEEVLMKDCQIKRRQLAGLWANVGNKGEKSCPETPELRWRIETIYEEAKGESRHGVLRDAESAGKASS